MNYSFRFSDYLLSPWPWLISAVVLFYLWKHHDKLFAWCCATVFAASAFSLSVDIFPNVHSVGHKKEILFGLMAFLCCLFFYVYPIKKKYIDQIFYFNLVFTFISWALDLKIRGMGINTSVNATCLVIMFACWQMNRKINLAVVITTAIALCLDKTSMGIIALLGGLLVYSPRLLKVAAPILLVVAFFYGEDLIFLTHREKMWIMAIEFYQKYNLYWLGTGWGSFSFIGPTIQSISKPVLRGYFVTLHSDVLQVFFETGIIGLISWAAYFIRGILTNRPCQRLFFTVVFISMIGNFPLRVPMSAIFIFWGFSYISRNNKWAKLKEI